VQVIRNVLAMLRLVIDQSDPTAGRRVFKAMYGEEKQERKKVIAYVEKVGRLDRASTRGRRSFGSIQAPH
jgi:hypothetical protein